MAAFKSLPLAIINQLKEFTQGFVLTGQDEQGKLFFIEHHANVVTEVGLKTYLSMRMEEELDALRDDVAVLAEEPERLEMDSNTGEIREVQDDDDDDDDDDESWRG